MVLFNDRLFEEGEVPSDGNNLSGYDEMSNDSNNDDGGSGSEGGGRDGRGAEVRRSRWVEDDSGSSNSKN